jgi:gluconate 5-dehydrogenase
MLTVNLEGELALITGGGTGIGYAIASAFVDAGASVVIVGRRADVLRDAAEQLGPKVFPITHDVTDLDSAEA